MNTSQLEITETLKSCLVIYQKLSTIPNYQPDEDEWGCIEEFKRLWDGGWLDDDTLLVAAGIPFESVGYIIGFATLKKPKLKQN